MHLETCRDQSSRTLDEFYEEIAAHDSHVDREGGRAMLDLIARLRALPHERRVWGLTSHYRLCLLAHDTYQSPRYVTVAALDRNNYSIDYLMPAAVAPWSGARVQGDARSEDDAVQMIVTAMERSEGWG
jgi:hypothetical protein